jgi:MFS family permease
MRSGYARLAALWFGVQFIWGAVLAVSLQARSVALTPDGLRAYASIAALGAIVGTIVQLAIGPLSDRHYARSGSRRIFYLTGVIVTIPAVAWLYLAPSYPQLVAAFLLLQVGMNTIIGPYQAILPDYVPRDRLGAASSWLGIFQPLGNACGLIVAGFVGDLRIVALVLIVAVVASWAVTARYVGQLTSQPPVREKFRVDRNFVTLIVSRTAINFGFYTLLGFLFFYVDQSLGVTGDAIRTQTALLFLTFTIANVGGALAAAKPVDRFDKRAVVLVANGIVAAGLVLLATTHLISLAFLAAAIAGVAWGAYFIADWALACALLPRSAMASAMGLWNVAAAIPQIVAPVFTAPIVEHVNAWTPGMGPRVAIGMAIVEFTIGALWLYWLPRASAASATR